MRRIILGFLSNLRHLMLVTTASSVFVVLNEFRPEIGPQTFVLDSPPPATTSSDLPTETSSSSAGSSTSTTASGTTLVTSVASSPPASSSGVASPGPSSPPRDSAGIVNDDDGGGLSTAATAGIGVGGAVFGILFLVAGGYYIFKKWKWIKELQEKAAAAEKVLRGSDNPDSSYKKPELDGSVPLDRQRPRSLALQELSGENEITELGVEDHERPAELLGDDSKRTGRRHHESVAELPV